MDDDLGADHVYDAARAELRLIGRLLRERSYSIETGRRLWAAAAEAARLAGWCAYDNGHIAASEKHFAASMRAAGNAADPTAAGTAAAFWANVRYSGGGHPDPGSAVDLVDQALAHGQIASGRVVTMLLIRRARAHSIAGNAPATYQAIEDALVTYEASGPTDEDLPSMYWITAGVMRSVNLSLLSGVSRRLYALAV